MITRNATRQNLSDPVLFDILAPTFFESGIALKGVSILVTGMWKTVTEAYAVISGQWKKVESIHIISSNNWKNLQD